MTEIEEEKSLAEIFFNTESDEFKDDTDDTEEFNDISTDNGIIEDNLYGIEDNSADYSEPYNTSEKINETAEKSYINKNYVMTDEINNGEHSEIEIYNETENTDTQFAEDEDARASFKSASEMTDEIIALTNRLDEQFRKKEERYGKKPVQEKKKYHIGSLSAALSLIYAGITLFYGLSVPNGVLLAFRFSPLILVFLGLEIVMNICLTRSFRLKFDLYGFILSASIIFVTCMTSLMFLGMTSSETTKDKTEKRLESEINHALTEEFITLNKLTKLAENEILIGNIESDVTIFGEDLYAYRNINDINENDIVNVKIYFNTAQKTLVKFAEDCIKTLEVLNETDYFKSSAGNIEFIGTDRGNYIHVSLNKRLQNHISAVEIAQLADYFAENLATDTEDLIQTVE